MISWDDAQTISQTQAQDTNASAVSFLNMMMNVGYKEVLVALGRQVTELQATTPTVATQRGYQVPPDCIFPKTLVLIDGTNESPIDAEASERLWNLRKQTQQTGRPTGFFFRPRFGVGAGVFELDPIPSSVYSLRLTYEATERDMSKSAYSTGTISVQNASATVVGVGTTFANDMVGRYLEVTGDGSQRIPYRIKTVTNGTSLILENVYHGGTQTSQAFRIFEMFALPEDIQILPVYYALWQWWDTKGNVLRAAKAEKQYENGLTDAKKRHSVTVRDAIISGDGVGQYPSIFGNSNPNYFPTSVT